MADIDVNLITRQYERILLELGSIRDRTSILASIRDEQNLMREQLRLLHTAIARLEDTMSLNVLERIRKLEERQPS